MNYTSEIELGAKYKDELTGFEVVPEADDEQIDWVYNVTLELGRNLRGVPTVDQAMPDEALNDMAIEVVAQHLLASFVDEAGEKWENYPEVGEQDFERIVETVKEWAPSPGSDQYKWAYARLEERAEKVTHS